MSAILQAIGSFFKYVKIALAVLLLAPAVIISSLYYKGHDAKAQKQRIQTLEQRYVDAGFSPVRESDFTSFDLEAALESGVKLNEVQFLATHNSYKQRMSRASYYAMNWVALPLRQVSEKDEWDYAFETLTQQLDRGIRSMELDVMKDRDIFLCGHVGFYDMRSSCPDLALACKEIKMWSDANPGHLPITLLVESKNSILADGAFYRPVNLDGVLALEKLFAREFGDTLLTPGEILGDYENFSELRQDNAWPALRDLLGKVLVLYHYNADITNDYIALDSSLRAQKLFPVLKFLVAEADMNAASFILSNDPLDSDAIADAMGQNLLVRTRIDMHMHHDKEAYDSGVQSGALLLSTDYPPRSELGKDPYIAMLEGGYTVKLR